MKPNHIVIDLKHCVTPLNEEHIIRTYIIFICRALNLKRRGGTIVDTFGGGDNGITAMQILETSSISIHTYPEYNSCNIDIFACSDFDPLTVFRLTLSFFGARGTFQEIHRTI